MLNKRVPWMINKTTVAKPTQQLTLHSTRATNEKEDAAPESKSLSMNVWGGCENDKHSIRISWWVFFSLYIYGTPILNARRDNGPRPVSAWWVYVEVYCLFVGFFFLASKLGRMEEEAHAHTHKHPFNCETLRNSLKPNISNGAKSIQGVCGLFIIFRFVYTDTHTFKHKHKHICNAHMLAITRCA